MKKERERLYPQLNQSYTDILKALDAPQWAIPSSDGSLYIDETAFPQVYITAQGEAYHLAKCSSLCKGKIQIDLTTAMYTHTPCKRCCPPHPDLTKAPWLTNYQEAVLLKQKYDIPPF